MLGAIIGDIVGSRFEFNNTDKTDFQFFTYECSYTDDTICTVAIADAILKGKSYKDSLQDWCRQYPNPKGAYGSLFSRWVRSDNPKPYNSFGNGSAMRVSPVAWAFPTIEDVYENAMLSAEVTHNHPEGMKGARCVAALIYCLLNKHISKNEVSKFILRHYGYSLRPLSQIIIANGFDETCQTTVPIAIRCFLDSNSFEETIRLAVSVGGDSDTIAAIAGSIAESYYPIPPKIKEEAIYYLPDDMKQVIGEFTMKFNHNMTINNG